MEQQMLSMIPTVGFGCVFCIYIFNYLKTYINKNNELNRQDMKEQMAELRKENKEQISELRRENKEEKDLFRNSIDSFNNAIEEFRNVQKETNTINSKITTIEKDISEIKTKIQK